MMALAGAEKSLNMCIYLDIVGLPEHDRWTEMPCQDRDIAHADAR